MGGYNPINNGVIMIIKLLKKYRGHKKGDEIEPLDSEITWLDEYGYIDKTEQKEDHTKVKSVTKKRNTRQPRKPKRS